MVGANQIAYAAYQMYNEEEFSHDRAWVHVSLARRRRMTNIRVDIKFKGHDIRTQFIEHGGETYVPSTRLRRLMALDGARRT